LTTLAKARVINYDHNSSFIVLATVITSVNYDCKAFIVQATGLVITVRLEVFLQKHACRHLRNRKQILGIAISIPVDANIVLVTGF